VPTHVALLRGINVGGRNKVAMSDLRTLVSSLGHADVATYIQSGNVVFTSGRASTGQADTAEVAADIEAAVSARLGVRPQVVVLSRDELAQVLRDNPYSSEPDPKKVHAVFLSATPGSGAASAVETAVESAVQRFAQRGSRDTARLVGRTIFLHTPDGFGRSDLAAQITRPKAPGSPELTTTARNWATVQKLLAMCVA
jgi:uncharacterized protein (DUF1697 family)